MASFKFDVHVEPDRNVMYMTQSGRPTAEDFENVQREILAVIDRLDRGFTLVNDQRRLEPFDENAMAVAKDLVKTVNRAGVSKVIRIVPADLLSMTKVLRAQVKAESQYRTIRVSSPAEAEEILETRESAEP